MRGFTLIKNELLGPSQLSIQARYLLMLLIKYSGQKDTCYPSQATLGKDMSLSVRHISTLLDEIEVAGFISRKRSGFNKTNTYTVAKSYVKSSSGHIGTKFPLHSGTVVPPKNTYIKGKDKKGLESLKEVLMKRGLYKPKEDSENPKYNQGK